MKQFRYFTCLVLFCIVLSACTSYEEPICRAENLVDVANFEGNFSSSFALVDKTKSRVFRQKVTVLRLGRGRYLMQSESRTDRISVCEIGGLIFAEGPMFFGAQPERTHAAYLMQQNGDGSFDLVVLAADSAVLNARGIPFKIEEVTGENRGELTVNNEGTYQIVVDNSKISPEEFVQLLDPLSMKITWLPEPSLH